jgi:hypothetical protein
MQPMALGDVSGDGFRDILINGSVVRSAEQRYRRRRRRRQSRRRRGPSGAARPIPGASVARAAAATALTRPPR